MTNKTIKLYKHQTDGGAVYLFDTKLSYMFMGKRINEGILNDKTKYVVRLDGKPELIIR